MLSGPRNAPLTSIRYYQQHHGFMTTQCWLPDTLQYLYSVSGGHSQLRPQVSIPSTDRSPAVPPQHPAATATDSSIEPLSRCLNLLTVIDRKKKGHPRHGHFPRHHQAIARKTCIRFCIFFSRIAPVPPPLQHSKRHCFCLYTNFRVNLAGSV
jgi:hypothetical protein